MGKWIVCSAWPYVNTVPHLGTFIHLLAADVYARYLRLRGEEVVSVTGSDEHGTPIEVEAIKAGIEPKVLTDRYHYVILDLLRQYRIELSNYTRTHNPVHMRFTQEFYSKVYKNGYVYAKKVALLYCGSCQRFLPDRFVQGACPYCGFDAARGDQCDNCGRVLDPVELKDAKCVFCGSTPTIRDSNQWFFDLPKFAEKVRSYLEENRRLPDNARNFSYRWLDEGLKARALTRDNKWGIPAPFPGAEDKTIYVWLEAVLGYVSATVEWAQKNNRPDLWKDFWFSKETRNIHFIGKDNIPFHTIIFPALLMASGDPYVLPWQVSSTEFILFEGKKFSKSRRIGVWMDEALKIAEPDCWRFVLIAIRPEAKDANFTWDDFESTVNAMLNDVIGNFVHRTLTFLGSYFKGNVPRPGPPDEIDKEFLRELEGASSKVGELMDGFRLRDALMEIVDLARAGNQYLSSREPWHTAKTDPERTATTLYYAAQMVRSLAILLVPFIPTTSEKIWNQLGMDGDVHEQRWETASLLALRENHKVGKPVPLFQKVDAHEVRRRLG